MKTTLLAIGAAATMLLSGCQNDSGMGDTNRTGMVAPREADTANVDMREDADDRMEDRQEMMDRNGSTSDGRMDADDRVDNDRDMDADDRAERNNMDPDDDRREGRVVVPPADPAPSASDSGG